MSKNHGVHYIYHGVPHFQSIGHLTTKNQKNTTTCKNEIPLIINELTSKTHETTGNKPEIKNYHNMTRDYHKKPDDRYKNAQPKMVPFDAEEGITNDK